MSGTVDMTSRLLSLAAICVTPQGPEYVLFEGFFRKLLNRTVLRCVCACAQAFVYVWIVPLQQLEEDLDSKSRKLD